jgi:hypothetical protein
MEQTTIEKINEVIKRHEKSLHCYRCGDEAEKIASIINDYERTAASEIAKRKVLIEQTLVYFQSVGMLCETVGMASTHGEKSARLRGLIELLNSAIGKLREEQTENLLENWRSFSWGFGTYPYQSIIRKYDELKQENEFLKSKLSSETPPPTEDTSEIPF